MTKQQRAEVILETLEKMFPEVPIPLNHNDPFTLTVAVVLSAQTTDKKVNEVTPLLFKKAGTPKKMKALGEKEILKIIRPLGLAPQKAKALEGLATMLLEKFNGQIPQTFDELIELPGVGRKTAQVVMAQAFGQDAFPVDTHIDRLAHRWKLTNAKSVLKTELDLKKTFPQNTWSKLHLQFIYYGRNVCPAPGCDAKRCLMCQKLFSK